MVSKESFLKNSDYWLGDYVYRIYTTPRKPLSKLFLMGVCFGLLSLLFVYLANIQIDLIKYSLLFIKVYAPVLALFAVFIGRKYDFSILKNQIISDSPAGGSGYLACRLGFAGFGFSVFLFGYLAAVFLTNLIIYYGGKI
jgi:hypothetical protein